MPRIEIFSDAAFAFAVTMLVVSLSSIPQNFVELVKAINGVPAFATSFAIITVFWAAHRSWSRRFGLEDGLSTVLTLGLIFVILIYVYPLKIMMTSFFYGVSKGWFPSQFEVTSSYEMTGLIIIYGIGVIVVSSIPTGLNLRVRNLAKPLGLDSMERLHVDHECTNWKAHVAVSFLSILFAMLFHSSFGYRGAFIYFLLPLSIPFIIIRYKKKAAVLLTAEENNSPPAPVAKV